MKKDLQKKFIYDQRTEKKNLRMLVMLQMKEECIKIVLGTM